MRTLLPEELKEQPLVKLAVGFTLFVMLAFVVTGFLLYFQHMDLSASSVVSYFAGSDDGYRPARTLESMLSMTHAHTVATGTALLLLSFVLIRSTLSSGTKKAMIALPFSAAILNESASWLVWAGLPGFAWVKILSFLILEISLVILILVLFASYFRMAKKVPDVGQPPRQPSPPVQRGGAPPQGRPPQQGGEQQGGFRRRRRRPRRRRGPGGAGGQAPQQGAPPPSA